MPNYTRTHVILYSENIRVTKKCLIGAIFWSIKLRQSTLFSKMFHCPLLWVFDLVSLRESCPVFFFSSSAPHFPKELSLLHKQASHPPSQIPMTTCIHQLTPLPFHPLCGCSIFEPCLSKSPPCLLTHIGKYRFLEVQKIKLWLTNELETLESSPNC